MVDPDGADHGAPSPVGARGWPAWRSRVVTVVVGWAVFAALWSLGQYFFLGRGRSFAACLVEGAIVAAVFEGLTPWVGRLLDRRKARSKRTADANGQRNS